ncbi:hypothetical protein EV183_001955 [Coemansia sp. RSA 2336]|nr:hypothetical protein EV183_001955 [Coemansia sp. RSA 2336]
MASVARGAGATSAGTAGFPVLPKDGEPETCDIGCELRAVLVAEGAAAVVNSGDDTAGFQGVRKTNKTAA